MHSHRNCTKDVDQFTIRGSTENSELDAHDEVESRSIERGSSAQMANPQLVQGKILFRVLRLVFYEARTIG